MRTNKVNEICSWTELNLTGSDLWSSVKGFLFIMTLSSLFLISLTTLVQPVSQTKSHSNANPESSYSSTQVYWGNMAFNCNTVPVSTFGYNGCGQEYASLNSSFLVKHIINPTGNYFFYDLSSLKYQESLWYKINFYYGMSNNSGITLVSGIYYTPSGIATREITWAPSFSATESDGFATLTTDVMIHERVFAESGSGAVTGQSYTNGNIVVHWGAILFTVLSFAVTS